jgi:RNA polymerase sigma factor (sigma-70 family)
MNNEELINGCLNGSRVHFDILYDKFSAGLYAICLRYSGDEDEAKDILQDGFIRVFTQLKTYDPQKGSFEGWLRRIFINLSVDYYRKRNLKVTAIDIENIGEEESEDPPVDAIPFDSLMKLVQKLPSGYRSVFNLFAIDQKSHREISEMLGITESTSKTQYFKARKYLQKEIKQFHLVSQSPAK